MTAEQKKNRKVISLVIALVVVLFGGVLFMGAVSGWFNDTKVTLDPEYYKEGIEFIDLSALEYEDLNHVKKSFLIFVDQDGCMTADRLRGYIQDYMKEAGISVYRMMFSDVKESSLHDFVKYYPSVVVIDRGIVRGYLKADSDADADAYNNYDVFKEWMGHYL